MSGKRLVLWMTAALVGIGAYVLLPPALNRGEWSRTDQYAHLPWEPKQQKSSRKAVDGGEAK